MQGDGWQGNGAGHYCTVLYCTAAAAAAVLYVNVLVKRACEKRLEAADGRRHVPRPLVQTLEGLKQHSRAASYRAIHVDVA